MPAGRPPKPTALKLLQGNPGKRKLNSEEPKPPTGPVKPPSWLRGRAKTAWKWVAPILEEMGVLTTADPHALALLCDAYAEYIECRAVVRKLGATYESRVIKTSTRRVAANASDEAEDITEAEEPFSGDDWSTIIRPRPEVKMYQDAWRRVHRMLSEFGMTPSSRSKVKGAPQEEADPFGDWARGSRSAS